MKVGDPSFNGFGMVFCIDCPFSTEDGDSATESCLTNKCPTAETYAAACELVDKEVSP